MTPITRKEMFLAKLSGEEVTTPDPITREELFLAKLCGESVKTPEPITRYEMFLDGLAGNEHTLTPVTRLEYFIAAAGGADVPELTPITREEMYWSDIEISGVEWTIITGVSPLALADALAKPIKKLIQYGKVTASNGEMYCNNGKLVAVDDELPSGYERQIGFGFAASTYYLISGFHLRGSDPVRFSFSADKACNVFGCYTTNSATDNYSLYASTSNGGKYLRYDGATYNSYIPSAQIGERLDVVITPTGTTGMPTDSVITPAEFEATVDLCIGTTSTSASSSKLDGNIWGNFEVDGRLTLIPCKRLSDDALGYYDPDSDTFYEPIGSAPTSLGVDSSHLNVLTIDGTPEVLTIGTQTATVANLFSTGTVHDEQDIISGVITRKTAVSVEGGVITISALSTPVTEHVTAQPLRTVEGSNTIAVTSAVAPVELEVEYAKAGA